MVKESERLPVRLKVKIRLVDSSSAKEEGLHESVITWRDGGVIHSETSRYMESPSIFCNVPPMSPVLP
jgi:hypothetical protein